MKEFYRQTVKEVLDRVESSEAGLTSEQADHSREKCGWNELTEGKKKSISQIFFESVQRFSGTYSYCIGTYLWDSW